jgi:hypothetical protein
MALQEFIYFNLGLFDRFFISRVDSECPNFDVGEA